MERVLAEFRDERRGSGPAREHEYCAHQGLLSDLIFRRADNLVSYPQMTVDQIISALKLKEEIAGEVLGGSPPLYIYDRRGYHAR